MLRKILHKPQAVLGLVMMFAVILIMALAPQFAPNDPNKVDILHKYVEPCEQYPLGTDDLGRCIESRLIYGARVSMSIALPTIIVIAVIITLLATVCAYIGGIADKIFVIADGNVAASGKHDELLSTCELYRNMWEAHSYARDKDDDIEKEGAYV